MRLAILCLALAAGMSAAGAAAATATTPTGGAHDLQLVDFTDDFARIWDATASLPDAERTARFKAEFAKILPGFYDHRRTGMSEAEYDERLLAGLKAYPEKRPGIDRVSREFTRLMAPSRESFEKMFGRMTGYPDVYLVNSIGEFDGGTRTLGGVEHLMFGADMIDKLYQTIPVQPFFHHELFHLYHGRRYDGCDTIACALWNEGLATHVAAQLNPGASDAALLLTFPVPLRDAVERDRPAAICSVVAKLNSTEGDDYAPLFQGRPQPGAAFPPRYGYFVGYLVAQDIGKTGTLKQLAELKAAEVRPLIENSLRSMASCPPNTTAVETPGERG